jgi:hypothetical protein
MDDIPDILLARLIRLWLTLSKQEGVEAKAQYRDIGSAGTPDGKKDAKKEKVEKQSPSVLKRPIPPKGF